MLYVDDEPENLALFEMQFAKSFSVLTANSGTQALERLNTGTVAVLLTDERMPGMTGIDLLSRVVERWPDTVRVIVSAYADAQRLLHAINRGHAHEYVVKPWIREELGACIERCLAVAARRRALAARAELAELYERDARETVRGAFMGAGLERAVSLARRAGNCDATVLLTGETGTGKEVVARLVHEGSSRAHGPFIRVNCAALSEGLLESELFGHEVGAFTGAQRMRRGRFELAQGGTILLDEIGDVSPKTQINLLRVLQEKEIERVGGSSAIKTDVRVIAATHRDLPSMVAAGSFRQDLYYRLNVIPIELPPLRDRPEDIAPLVEYFLAKHARVPVPKVEPEVLERMRAYAWPGNVRELENLVLRAVALCTGPVLSVDDFALVLPKPEPVPSVRQQAHELEAAQIKRLLLEHGGNVAQAARVLGVPRTTLLGRAKRSGVVL